MKKVAIIILFFISFINCEDNKPQKFDATKWKTASQEEKGLMASDLVENKILIGKSKAEVLQLIGEPKDSSDINFSYIIDFGFMVPFIMDVSFNNNEGNVIKVTLSD